MRLFSLRLSLVYVLLVTINQRGFSCLGIPRNQSCIAFLALFFICIWCFTQI